MAEEEKKEPEAKKEQPEAKEAKEEKQETPSEKSEDIKTAPTPQPEESDAEAPAVPMQEKKPKEEKPSDTKVVEDKPAPSGKYADLIKQIEELSVADLADLVKELETRFGVSASVAAAPMGGGAAGAQAAGEAAEEKENYTVMLKDSGAQKIAVIKAVREVLSDLGLKEAKDLVDGAPKEVKKDMPKAEAEEAKKKLETAGATVELI